MFAAAPAHGVPLRPHVLSRLLDQCAEHLAEVVGRCSIRVEPLGREQLAPRTLVLLTGLEAGNEPAVDVVAAHDVGIGT